MLIIRMPLLSCQLNHLHGLSVTVHVSLHWSKYDAENLELWDFDVKNAVWLHNRISNHFFGLTPLELFTKAKANHYELLCTHVWGCPVYVLDPKLHDGQKMPKWNCWSNMGQFISSLVPNVHYLSTDYLSPQYNLIFDNLFETVFSTSNDAPLDDIFNHPFYSYFWLIFLWWQVNLW